MDLTLLLPGTVRDRFRYPPSSDSLALMPSIMNPAGTHYYFAAYVDALQKTTGQIEAGHWWQEVNSFNAKQGTVISARLRRDMKAFLTRHPYWSLAEVIAFFAVNKRTVENWVMTSRLPMPAKGISGKRLWELCQFTGPDQP